MSGTWKHNAIEIGIEYVIEKNLKFQIKFDNELNIQIGRQDRYVTEKKFKSANKFWA